MNNNIMVTEIHDINKFINLQKQYLKTLAESIDLSKLVNTSGSIGGWTISRGDDKEQEN